VKKTIALEAGDLKLQQLLGGQMERLHDGLQPFPEVGPQRGILEGREGAIEVERELGFRACQDHTAVFFRLLQAKTGVKRKAVESA